MKYSILITVIIAIFVCVNPCYAQLDDKALAKTFFDKGMSAYDSDDYYAAMFYFEEALEYDPNYQPAQRYLKDAKTTKIKELYEKAFNYIAVKKEYFRAEETLIEILEIDPRQRKAQVYLTREMPRLIDKLTKDLTSEEIEKMRKDLLGDFVPQDITKTPMGKVNTQLVLSKQMEPATDAKFDTSEKVVIEEKVDVVPRKRIIVYPGKKIVKVRPRIDFIRQELDRLEVQPVIRGDVVEKIDVDTIDVAEFEELSKKLRQINRDLNQYIDFLDAKPTVVSYVVHTPARYAIINDTLHGIERTRRYQREKSRPRKYIIRRVISYPAALREQTYAPSLVTGFMKIPDDYPSEGVVGLLYGEAFTHYKNNNLPMAKDYFQKVLLIDPGESLAQKFLYNINRGLISIH